MIADYKQESLILKPIKPEDFFHNFWCKNKPLHIKRPYPEYFANIISLEEIDRLVCSTRIPPTNFNMARNNAPLPISSYCTGGFVDRKKALSKHRQGATIILRSIEQWSPPFSKIRCEIEKLLGFEAQINVYLTPAQEKSTPPHWDTHDLFVLQLKGSKVWRIFEGNRTSPLENERFSINGDYVGNQTEEISVNQGDTFFLPRGIIHEPIASSYSIHASVGIRSLRWLDVSLNAIKIAAKENGAFWRETVNISEGTKIEKFQNELAKISENFDFLKKIVDQTLEFQHSRHWIDFEGSLSRRLNSSSIINEDSKFQLFPSSEVSVKNLKNGIEISAGAGKLLLPLKMVRAFDKVQKVTSFQISDLPGLNKDEKIAFCTALKEIGVLHETVS